MSTHRSTGPVRIAIALPGLLATLGLRHLIERIAGAEVCGTASCRDGLARVLREQRPDVLVVDPGLLPVTDPPVPLSGTRVLHISPYPHLRPGPRSDSACGFVSERGELERVYAALEIITRCTVSNGHRGDCTACPLSDSLQSAPLPVLSARELEVFALISQGLGTTAISRRLGPSIKTIETHRENIKRKLGLGSAMDLVDLARRWSRGESIDDAFPGRSAQAARRRGRA